MTRFTTTLLGLSLFLLAACTSPPVDEFRSDGGAAPDPTGVIEGTVLYAGPRPLCAYEDGVPVRALGRVVLTLFEFDNPPPPTGTATGAANLLTVPAARVFRSLGDCMPEAPAPADLRVVVMRSVDFTWPEIELGHDGDISYQIRGYYDRDEDFIPFFSVSNLPTAGDIAGGAVVDVTAPIPEFARITFGPQSERPLGEVVSGVSVALARFVNTERPVFTMRSEPLSAQATLPTTADVIEAERELAELTNTSLVLYPRDTDASSAIGTALSEAGLSVAFDDPVSYAWYVRPIDADGDGVGDPHPILGRSRGIVWQTPGVIMQRVQTDLERAAGIPSVTLLPTVRPTQTTFKKVFYPEIEVAIPPVAVVQLAPPPQCLVPYVPPGNITPFYEEATVECQELPAGRYGINVLHGVAGGLPVGGGSMSCADPSDCAAGSTCMGGACVVPSMLSDTSINLSGGLYSSQAWTLPNELGDGAQIATPDPAQGPASLFIVFDPNAAGPVGRLDGRDGCDTALDPVLLGMGMTPAESTREIVYQDFADLPAGTKELCCEPVAHLCGVPLCGAEPGDASGNLIRSAPTSIDDDGVPDCVPFLMPAACCS